MTDNTLWGNINEFKKIKTPKLILQELADELSEKTKGDLKAEIDTYTVDEDNYRITLDIIAKQLRHYRVRILECRHTRTYYPAEIHNDTLNTWEKVEDSERFREQLRVIIKSDNVASIIGGLLSEIEAEKQSKFDEDIPF